MKNLLKKFVVAGLSAYFLVPAAIHAAPSAGDQGYGVMLGNPTGLSGKVWFNDQIALDAAFGIDQGELDTHLTLLFHDNHLLKQLNIQPANSSLSLPVYIGVGPRILFNDNTEVGIRTPIGVSFFPAATDWEMFAEIAPVIRLSPDAGLDGDFAIGARYYFHAIRPQQQ